MSARYYPPPRAARRLATVLTLLGLTACTIGGSLRTFQPAGAAGITVRFMFPGTGGVREAEVLTVRDSGLVVVQADTVKLLRYADARQLEFRVVGLRVTNGRPLGSAAREEIRLLSRYPQGINLDLERRLLAAYGQARIGLAVP